MRLTFEARGLSDYLYWQSADPKMLGRINALIQDIMRSPFRGIGKPEPLREKPNQGSGSLEDMSRDVRRRSLDALNKLNIEQQKLFEPDGLGSRISQYEFAYRMQSALPKVFRGKAFIDLDDNAENVVIKVPKQDQAELLDLIEALARNASVE